MYEYMLSGLFILILVYIISDTKVSYADYKDDKECKDLPEISSSLCLNCNAPMLLAPTFEKDSLPSLFYTKKYKRWIRECSNCDYSKVIKVKL